MSSFFDKSVFSCSFSLLTVLICNFWQKNISTKAARKILVKLTTGLQTQAVSTQSSAKYFCTKTACQILVKLTPGV